MMRRPFLGLRDLATEAVGSLLLVVVLFALFMFFLYAIFPSGTQLKELVREGMEKGEGTPAAERKPEATLFSLYRDVRFRRGNAVEWGGARAGMQLYDQDAVQTLDSARAAISFGGGDRLGVGSNSLVVVTRLNPRDDAGERSYRVQVAGDVSGTLSSANLGLELASAGHVARILPGRARFRLTRDGDSAANLAVLEGEAQLASEGRVIRVPAHYGIRLLNGAPAGSAVPLPAAPRLETEIAHYRYRLLPPRITFAWKGGAPGYRFQLSRDERFRRCLVDEKLADSRFVTGKLESGSYFWRVSGMRDGLEGGFSRTGRCRLEQVLKAPQLTVHFPEQRPSAGPFLLTGSLEPGSRIYVNGAEAASDGMGGFRHEIIIKPGVNLIRVEAVDATGNASYASRVVYGGGENADGQRAAAGAETAP